MPQLYMGRSVTRSDVPGRYRRNGQHDSSTRIWRAIKTVLNACKSENCTRAQAVNYATPEVKATLKPPEVKDLCVHQSCLDQDRSTGMLLPMLQTRTLAGLHRVSPRARLCTWCPRVPTLSIVPFSAFRCRASDTFAICVLTAAHAGLSNIILPKVVQHLLSLLSFYNVQQQQVSCSINTVNCSVIIRIQYIHRVCQRARHGMLVNLAMPSRQACSGHLANQLAQGSAPGMCGCATSLVTTF